MSSTDSLSSCLLQLLDADFVSQTTAALDPEWFPSELLPEMKAYATNKIDVIHEMVDAMGHEDDEPELYRSLALLWLELKFEWQRYNQVMNYQVMLKGEADPRVFAKGGICSSAIALIEGLLEPGDLEQLVDLSAAPLEFGKPDHSRLRAYLDRHEARAQEAVARASAVRNKVKGSTEDAALLALADSTHALAVTPLTLAWPEIHDTVVANITRPGWRYNLRWAGNEGDMDVRLYSRLRATIQGATELLIHHDTHDTVEERMVNHAAAITVTVEVTMLDAHSLQLVVQSDTAGRLGSTASSDAAWARFTAGTDDATYASTPGSGTMITVRLDANGATAAAAR